jgi:hypothetical protein
VAFRVYVAGTRSIVAKAYSMNQSVLPLTQGIYPGCIFLKNDQPVFVLENSRSSIFQHLTRSLKC